MKKHLLRFFIAALCMAAMNTLSAKQLYVVGTDNAWSTVSYASTLDEKTDDPGVYEGTIVLANTSSWFAVVDQMCETENDWTGFNKHRYGMQFADSMTPMTLGQPLSIIYGYDEGSDSPEVPAFYFDQAGTYTFTIDTNNMTATISDGAAYPECVYVLGSDNVWNPSAPSATLTRGRLQGVYEGDVTMTNTYFALGTALGSNASDWGTFNASRYAPEQADQLLGMGQTLPIFKGQDRSFKVLSTGEYRLTVDLKAMTVTLTGSLPKQLYIIDTTPETPDYATPLATLTPGADGWYRGTVTFTGTQFALTSKIGDEETVFDNSYSRSTDNKWVRINYVNEICSSATMMLLEDPGTYNVAVDLYSSTAYFEKDGYVPPMPYTLSVTNEDGSTVSILSDDDKRHVYTGEVLLGESTDLYSITSGTVNVSLAGKLTLWANTTTDITTGKDAPNKMYIEKPAGQDNIYMTVDLDNNRIVTYGADYIYPVGYPNELYVVGNAQGWYCNIPQCVLKETAESGVYEGEVSLYNGAYFAILQRLGWDWGFVNDKRLTPAEDGTLAEAGQDISYSVYDMSGLYYAGAWMFSGEEGTYTMTVDMRTSTFKLTKKTPSGIGGVAEATEGAQQPLYDLQGRRVNGKTAPGIYVQQGKKMVVK